MGGFFGVASKRDCVTDLFFGTDYHSHLGTMRGGLATKGDAGFCRYIHDITNTQFRSKFEHDVTLMSGNLGIGSISDTDSQPLIISSHLGTYAIATVGVLQNIHELATEAFKDRRAHLTEMSDGEVNPTEVVSLLINQGDSFTEGLRIAQRAIEGSCSILLLTDDGIYASRDRRGRTPIILGEKEGSFAATMETAAFPNLGFTTLRDLGPAEIVLMTPEGIEQKSPPGDEMQICSFLWVYYGYPASTYEGINAEDARNRCGAALARNDDVEVDCAAGIPDSGTAHAIGYAVEAGVPYRRPYVKYTPTWPRSFMPQDQSIRDLVARMKLIPIPELIKDKRLLFCEDSIVRGTQLQDIVLRLFDYGAKQIHMRPACPPLVYGCKYLNFSRSRSELDLATRAAIRELEGDENANLAAYADPDTPEYAAMIERIRDRLHLTSLKFQRLSDLVEAIGLPKEKLCTYCWDGCEGCKKG
jgi:amidophosphoribosyltransferase